MPKESQPPAHEPAIKASGRSHEENLEIVQGGVILKTTYQLFLNQDPAVVDRMATVIQRSRSEGKKRTGGHWRKSFAQRAGSMAANPTKGRST